MVFFLVLSCTKDYTLREFSSEVIAEKPLLSLSYKTTTFRDYNFEPSSMTEIELSSLNPSSEKQEVTMNLYETGQLSIIIEEIDFEKKINIPHQVLPDDTPQVSKTVISDNTIRFYDKNGSLLGTEHMPLPDHSDLVKTINDMGDEHSDEDINKVVTTMQGDHLGDNLEDFLKDLIEEKQDDNDFEYQSFAESNGITIIKQDEKHVTLRVPLNNINPAISEVAVLLIDKSANKLVGTRMYDASNKLLQTTYLGYNKGVVAYLNAIKTLEIEELPSGKKVEHITYTEINDFDFNLNL